MKSIIIRQVGGPEVLEMIDSPEPTAAAGEIVIRTKAIAVSKPDVLIRKGIYTWSPPLPDNPGNELAGVVDSIGEGVSHLKPGQRVLLSARELPVRGGCYTEMVAVPATSVHVFPDNVAFEQAVVLPTYVVAYGMLFRLGLDFTANAKSIFINGAAGGVGGALADLAHSQGISVIGSVSSERKAAFAQQCGVDHIINYKTENVLERVIAITHGRGVDASFDHVIGAGFIDFIQMLADFGTVVAYNVFSPMPDKDVYDEMRKLSTRSLGLRVFNVHTYDHDRAALRKITAELIQLLADKKINPHVGKKLPMAEVAEAHRLLESGEVLGKIVLTV